MGLQHRKRPAHSPQRLEIASKSTRNRLETPLLQGLAAIAGLLEQGNHDLNVPSHRYAKQHMLAPYLEPVAEDFDVIAPQAPSEPKSSKEAPKSLDSLNISGNHRKKKKKRKEKSNDIN